MKRVVIAQKSLPHYRKPFFDHLRGLCVEQGVELEVVYGNGSPADREKGDLVDLPWGTQTNNRIFHSRFGDLWWQPILDKTRVSDLVIVEQANKLLVNYLLQLGRVLGGPRVGFWGHGRNFQGGDRVSEFIKSRLARHVDWWFAYNEVSVEVVRKLGFPAERITNVQNAIDTRSLREIRETLPSEKVDEMRSRYGLHGTDVCVYCGGLYPDKKLPFLFEAAERIKEQRPAFVLAVIGDGISRPVVERAAERWTWVRYLGPRFAEDKAAVFRLAQLQLMPGLVGLGILDSFALGVPLVTTDIPSHSPEICYLEPGFNGEMLPHDVVTYADHVAKLLADRQRLMRLQQGAATSGDRYSIEAMAENFAGGIVAALGTT